MIYVGRFFLYGFRVWYTPVSITASELVQRTQLEKKSDVKCQRTIEQRQIG